MAHRSLLLKDYLELESSSESLRWASLQRARPFSGGEISVRRLLETELSGGADYSGWRLVRFRSKCVLSKLSAVIRAVQPSADEPPRATVDVGGGGALSRSFSKKLKRGFWKKRGHEKDDGKVMATAVEGAFEEEAPISGYLFYSSANNEMCGKDMDCPSEEEKEQLSPVSVMDFPYQDGDEDEGVEQPSAASPCFEQSVGNHERTKNQLLQKIRRLECLADLDPQDLNNLFQCSEVHHVAAKEERWRRAACSLLRRVDGVDETDCGEKLLFDFFIEGLSFREECGPGTTSGSAGDEELLRAAHGWLAGEGFNAEGCCEEGAMEMGTRGWRRFKEEEAVVAVEITDGLLRRLMAEFVVELMSALF